jgi:hypothetical protein
VQGWGKEKPYYFARKYSWFIALSMHRDRNFSMSAIA